MDPDRLHDIVTPAPISWIPQTIGWYLVALLATLVALRWGWLRYRAWLAARYRREALAELDEIRALLAEPGTQARGLVAIPPLVKRVALSCSPRTEVASLTDTAWLDFLDETIHRSAFRDGPGSLLPTLAYAAPARLEEVPDSQVSALVELIDEWIRSHEIPAPTGSAAH